MKKNAFTLIELLVRAKHCSGYQSFPRKFKDMIKELNILFGSNIIG